MRRVNSTLAILSVLALSALGVILSFSIPSSVFPEITFDRAIILADSGDLPAAADAGQRHASARGGSLRRRRR